MSSLPARQDTSARDILAIAAWFGLVTGLVEGTALWALRALGWLTWDMARVAVAIEIVWISPVFDLIIFGAVGVALALCGGFFPRLPITRWAIATFTFLALFDWLALTLLGRVYHPTILMLAVGLTVVIMRSVAARQAVAVRFIRRTLPWMACVAVLALVAIQGAAWVKERIAIATLPAARPGLPNILVIVIDTLRADHLSSYGYSRVTSPNVDRLAQQGALFERALATSSWTPPSHASMLTGRYPFEHGVEWNSSLDDRYTTIGETLRTQGYRTGAFSGNYIFFTRDGGFDRGFMRFEDYFHSFTDMALRTLYGRELQFLVLRNSGPGDYPARKRASDVTGAALRWINQDHDAPFFAFLNYFDAHAPYLPPQPFRGKFSPGGSPGGHITGFARNPDPQLTPEQRQSEIDAYDGAIAYMDDSIGQLLADLEANGLSQNTLVVITSDHGEAFGEHGVLGHRNGLYREVIHVPLILWWPGHIPAGVRRAQAVSNIALPATILDLLKLTEEPSFRGPSLARLFQDGAIEAESPAPLAEIARQPFEPLRRRPVYSGALKSLLGPQWHYIVHEKQGEELYDWQTDPQEQQNLADSPSAQEQLERLRKELAQLLPAAKAFPAESQHVNRNPGAATTRPHVDPEGH